MQRNIIFYRWRFLLDSVHSEALINRTFIKLTLLQRALGEIIITQVQIKFHVVTWNIGWRMLKAWKSCELWLTWARLLIILYAFMWKSICIIIYASDISKICREGKMWKICEESIWISIVPFSSFEIVFMLSYYSEQKQANRKSMKGL